ncbi:hypothetical protein PanWU01x14_242500 [Parasponia andersonii]|uniref:Uncharacterized protein n=1 Tax=Parasponia andersonii TaxID=3476 RepID=A0A2P5BG14_PARAD|nr:hypothetical protein PanWU01x14_242500 [Parasponia andersonii]
MWGIVSPITRCGASYVRSPDVGHRMSDHPIEIKIKRSKLRHEVPTIKLPVRRRAHGDQIRGERWPESAPVRKRSNGAFCVFPAIGGSDGADSGGGSFVRQLGVDIGRWRGASMAGGGSTELRRISGFGFFSGDQIKKEWENVGIYGQFL